MDRPPLSTRKKEGGTARFECLVSGTPYPVTKITWEKEGDSVEAVSALSLNFVQFSLCCIVSHNAN